MKKHILFLSACLSAISMMAAQPQVSQDADQQNHAVTRNIQVNQARLTLKSGQEMYYNTSEVSAIEMNQTPGHVVVKTNSATDTYNGNVARISFAKKVNPAATVQVEGARGWLESAYVKFNHFAGATNYYVYVKGGQYSDFTRIDESLVRDYGTYNRADALGLRAGLYEMKVVPVIDGIEVASAATTVSNLDVRAYRRDGYAHHQAVAGVGAYNNDGTLKEGARVLYVSKKNAKSVTLSMQINGGKEEVRTGIQDILAAYEKGVETRPLAIRILGQLKLSDMPTLGSSAIGLQVKGKAQNMNLTIEGVGNDATLHGYGILCRSCRYVELRNFAVMMHPDDGISFDTDNEHLWGHNLDIFYGQNKGGDKSKGDGSFDVKGTYYCTVADNHFWDSGKCTLNSNGDQVDYVTYHHNWYDHSDSRHPRVRVSKHLHVFNNYYDGNAKYGVGATTGSCIFVEKNYYRNCKYPMLISKQGSDVHNGLGSSDATKGTFSSEDGGMIKAYDNYMTGQISFEPYQEGHATYGKHFDAYVVSSREQTVPETVLTLQGGTGYNNFDTEADFYTYTPDEVQTVPSVVTGHYGAGRCEHGDFQYAFDNSTQDGNADVILDLSNKLSAYNGSLVKVYGAMGAIQDENNGDDNQQEEGGEVTPQNPMEEGDIIATFDGASSHAMFTVAGNYGDGKITYNGTSLKKGVKLDSKGSVTFTPQKNYQMILVLATAKDGRDVKLNDNTTTVSGTLNAEGAYYEMQPIQLTANKQYVISKGSKEGMLMLIKLVPTE